MKQFTPKILIALVMFSAINMFSVKMRTNMLFTAKMDGAQETPSVSGTGMGLGSLMLNGTKDTLCINVIFNGLTGNATGAHIHMGATGVAGGVVVDLTPYIVGNKLSATITGTALSASLKSNMLKGLTYLNVHTSANPNGEIRGQIWLESDMAFCGAMDGAQESPSVATSANGYAVFNLSKHQGKIKFYVVTNGLSGAITSAHIHTGAIGVAGPIIQDLGAFMNGNSLSGAFTPSANVIANLMAGTAYINVHTAANPNGEIRGQLKMDDKITFDAWMDGAQETPSVATSAKGLSSLKLNTTMDTLWYSVYTNGLSGAITMAHIHIGAVGVSGSPVVTFTTPTGNQITGISTGTDVNTALINNMLMGLSYVNVHTAANPNGEIRGQVYRVMREGYNIAMDGAQENPNVNTSAKGVGIVSIDRDMDNAHYMVVSDIATANGFHFHKAAMGVNGNVINDLTTMYSNNGAFGYWKSTDTSPFSPFTTSIANQFDNDSIYANIHTVANPNGEIRGQVMAGSKCNNIVTGIENLKAANENKLFISPNPATNFFNAYLNSSSEERITLSVYNAIGKLIILNNYDIQTGKNVLNVDLKNAPSGIYFVKITKSKQEITKKLIVE